tara:strand:- start:1 stop:204 length:204 start_codon:yes stop_codon:yes gene_type:complete
MKSRQKTLKHIEDMRREVVELCSTTSNKVRIARLWEAATGNVALHDNNNEELKDGYVNVIIYNKPDK